MIFTALLALPRCLPDSICKRLYKGIYYNNGGISIGNISSSRHGAVIVTVGTLNEPSVYLAKMAIFNRDLQPFHYIEKGPYCRTGDRQKRYEGRFAF